MDSRPNIKISSKVVAKAFETLVETESSCNSAFESECQSSLGHNQGVQCVR
jgi:hypothetical protein